jgi:hypothetical protein
MQGRATGFVLALALAAPAVVTAAIVPDASEVPAGAQPIEQLPAKASEVLDRPGDQDWYTIFGRNPDDSVNAVFVRVLRTTPTCTAPLRVALFNPEQRWMRTTQSSAGNVATVLVPRLTSRYLIRVDAVEPACTGLEYEVTYVPTDPPKPDGSASKCVVARAARIDAKDRLKMLEVARPKYAPDSRPRYDRYIRRAKLAVTAANKSVKRNCT